MTCEEVQEWISRFADDEPESTSTEPMFAHLGTCPECQQYLRTVLRVRTALAHEPHATAPGTFEHRVMARLRRTTSSVQLPADVWSIRIAIPLPAAMAMAILLIAGSMVFSPLFFEQPPSLRISEESLQQLPGELRSSVRITQIMFGQ